MHKATKKILNVLLVLALVVMAFLLPTFTSGTVYADTEDPSVLQDLHKDEKFDESAYPVVGDDYSLKVIQIAESADNELFVYVYQPCSPNVDLWATTINISVGVDENLSYKNYELELLSASGVFYKYKVVNLAVDTTRTVRYYDISSIMRKWSRKYDEVIEDGEIGEVPFKVGQRWAASSVGEGTVYEYIYTEVVTITEKFVGNILYFDGYKGNDVVGPLMPAFTESHFVAFSTDKQIDKLFEVDIEFTTQDYTIETSSKKLSGDIVKHEETLTADDKGHNVGGGAFGSKYTWYRIENCYDFANDENNGLNDDVKRELSTKDWVLRFYETPFTSHSLPPSVRGTNVNDVIILRLKFETDGVPYNLGVVDNKQSGDDKADGTVVPEFFENLARFWNSLTLTLKILFITGLVLAGLIVIVVIYKILKAIWDFARSGSNKDKES